MNRTVDFKGTIGAVYTTELHPDAVLSLSDDDFEELMNRTPMAEESGLDATMVIHSGTVDHYVYARQNSDGGVSVLMTADDKFGYYEYLVPLNEEETKTLLDELNKAVKEKSKPSKAEKTVEER